jgi:hypothetical protein
VVDVTLRIVPNRPVRKTMTEITPNDFVAMVEAAAEAAAGLWFVHLLLRDIEYRVYNIDSTVCTV